MVSKESGPTPLETPELPVLPPPAPHPSYSPVPSSPLEQVTAASPRLKGTS